MNETLTGADFRKRVFETRPCEHVRVQMLTAVSTDSLTEKVNEFLHGLALKGVRTEVIRLHCFQLSSVDVGWPAVMIEWREMVRVPVTTD